MRVKGLKRFIFRLIFALLAMYFLLLFIISTNPGTRLLLSIVSYATSQQLQFGDVNGAVTSGLAVNNLVYHDKHIDAAVKHAAVQIDLLALFSMQIYIKQLEVDNAKIKITADNNNTPKNNFTFNPPTWLRFIDLNKININNVTIKDDYNVYHLDSALITRIALNTYHYTVNSNIGIVEGTLSLQTYPLLSWNLHANIRNLNLDAYNVSSVSLAVKTHGEWGLFKKQAYLSIDDISGKIDSKNLSGGAIANYHNGELKIDKLRLLFGNTHLDATGIIGSNINFNWNLAIPDISMLLPDAAGSIISQGSITGTLAKPVINAHIANKNLQLPDLLIKNIDTTIKTENTDINNIEMKILANDIRYFDLTLSSAEIHAKSRLSKKSGLITNITGRVDSSTKINGSVNLPDFTSFSKLDQEIVSNINLDTANLTTLPISIPFVNNLNGQLHAVFAMQGKLNKPSWSLNADIVNGAVTIPVTSMDIRNVSVNATLELGKPLALNGKFTSGNGNGSLTGGLTFNNKGYHFVLNVTGNNLQIANTHEYKIVASPDIIFSMTHAGANITGSVLIPKASIHPVNFTQVIRIPDETTFVHQKKLESVLYRNLVLDIDSKFGDDIQINYDQLKTRLYGDVNIVKSAGTPPTAIGDLYTDNGYYKAYGTKLKIATGRTIYTGNLLTNPGIDIRAVKEIKKVVNSDDVSSLNSDGQLIVGVQVIGTASKPSISFFSMPDGLSQKDILSYLVFGYPQSQVTSASGLAILNSIGPTGNTAAGITNGLQNTLGLNELGLSSTEYYNSSTSQTGSTTTVNIGKNVTKDLSIHYSVGLLYPVSVLNIVYQINRHLKLQAETSTLENGADIMYSLERK